MDLRIGADDSVAIFGASGSDRSRLMYALGCLGSRIVKGVEI